MTNRSDRIHVTHNNFDGGHHNALQPVVDPQHDRQRKNIRPAVTRRSLLAGGAAVLASGVPVAVSAAVSFAPSVRLGVLQFGTVQWIGDIIQRHGLDDANGFKLASAMLANTDAGRVALMANAADIVVSDWMFVASQRAAGTKLCFAPFSSATGAIMAGKNSPVRSLADLSRRKLGVAGGPVDKSWLIVRAAAKAAGGADLAQAADVVFGAPPLLNAKLMQGELDAVLTYWNFAARLDAAGYRQVTSVDDCATGLGLPVAMSLVGFVFHEEWAAQNVDAVNGFLAAAAAAGDLLAKSDAEWQQIRPLMNATDDALFERLKQRFVAGIVHPSAEAQERAAAQLFAVLLSTGGSRATDGLTNLPPGMFWPVPAPHG
jgi:NitT/TauT family transport system substrate-binding protein